MPFFSIITINFNNAAGLQKTIDSVLQQSFKGIEYVVIDGGSADNSLKVIEANKSSLHYYTSEKDSGIYNAMNKGIEKVTGEYLLFLNSGDYLIDENVLKQIASTNPVADILYGDVLLTQNGRVIREKKYPEKLSNYFLLTDNLAHQSQFIKLNLFKEYGYYNEQFKIVADYEFFMRMYYLHKRSYSYLNKVTTVYNLDGLSAAKNQIAAINKERYAIQKLYMPLWLVFAYRVYATMLQSKVYQLKPVAALIHILRNLAFKVIKPKANFYD